MITRRDFCLGLGAAGLSLSAYNGLFANTKEKPPALNESPLTQGLTRRPPNIKVIGVGGAGVSTVERILADPSNMTECIVVDDYKTYTPDRILSFATHRMPLPDRHEIVSKRQMEGIGIEGRLFLNIEGADMIFITAGMGGLTGTEAAPFIAQFARGLGIMTVGVVTMPFHYEGTKVNAHAENGVNKLRKYADAVITIHNEMISELPETDVSLLKGFSKANDIRASHTKAICDAILCPSVISMDFDDVITVLKYPGNTAMCFGDSKGSNGSFMAARAAIYSPLWDGPSVLKKATGILLNVTFGPDWSLDDIFTVASSVYAMSSTEADILVGAIVDPAMEDRVRVTIIGTGITT